MEAELALKAPYLGSGSAGSVAQVLQDLETPITARGDLDLEHLASKIMR